jgi:formate-dependent nitrite reductase cytochrome c552 subunit
MKCPKCHYHGYEKEVCDNDCKTIICPKCHFEFYLDELGRAKPGHDPHCGDFEVDIPDDVDFTVPPPQNT